jgi:ATP synthase protein I
MKNLKEISTRLEIAKKKIKDRHVENDGTNVSSLGVGLKISTELVVSVVVGATIGFILDSWFDTKPVLIICFFVIGAIAGIWNVIKVAKKMQNKIKG